MRDVIKLVNDCMREDRMRGRKRKSQREKSRIRRSADFS